jgi:uncharacterized RDD family membrane protein YckC
VEYEDKIRIATPEGIELEYTLAGLGSRFGAALIDVIIRLVLLGAIYGVLVAVLANTVGAIILVIAIFFAIFGYDIVFEVWGGGRTPGKRWSGLRVVMATGQPVGFAASAVRNLMRIIDIYATVFIAGIVSILTTKRNQRLGDLAGHTLVLRERHADVTVAPASDGAATVAQGLDVTAVTSTELAAIREFLVRRDNLAREARDRVGLTLANGLRSKVGGLPPGELPPERLLEMIAAAKSAPR